MIPRVTILICFFINIACSNDETIAITSNETSLLVKVMSFEGELFPYPVTVSLYNSIEDWKHEINCIAELTCNQSDSTILFRNLQPKQYYVNAQGGRAKVNWKYEIVTPVIKENQVNEFITTIDRSLGLLASGNGKSWYLVMVRKNGGPIQFTNSICNYLLEDVDVATYYKSGEYRYFGLNNCASIQVLSEDGFWDLAADNGSLQYTFDSRVERMKIDFLNVYTFQVEFEDDNKDKYELYYQLKG